MLENDHPGSVGKILQNLLEKVEAASLQLNLPEKLVVLRAGSVFRNGPEESETVDDNSYDFSSFREGDSFGKSTKKETLTAVKDLIEMHMRKQLDDQTTRLLFAASRGDTATISLMCDQGFDPNNADYDHRTGLMVAAMKGNTDICNNPTKTSPIHLVQGVVSPKKSPQTIPEPLGGTHPVD